MQKYTISKNLNFKFVLGGGQTHLNKKSPYFSGSWVGTSALAGRDSIGRKEKSLQEPVRRK